MGRKISLCLSEARAILPLPAPHDCGRLPQSRGGIQNSLRCCCKVLEPVQLATDAANPSGNNCPPCSQSRRQIFVVWSFTQVVRPVEDRFKDRAQQRLAKRHFKSK